MSREGKNTPIRILLDAREFVPGRLTGIGRVLVGLIHALGEVNWAGKIILAGNSLDAVPSMLKTRENISFSPLPSSFLGSELALSRLADDSIGIFISPYPKLPLFGVKCSAAHFVHDILDLTHPAYRKRLKRPFDSWRLKQALKKADLTWYDSKWSMKETLKYAGAVGRNPKVRHLGIDERFTLRGHKDSLVIKGYGLEPGYILTVGNGKPHKNLGVLLGLSGRLKRAVVLVGVPGEYRRFWTTRYPESRANWIEQVSDDDLPSVMRKAFCLAQPSTAEGYGYPPLEAMACGVPCVVSNIEVLMETTGGNALVADPHDGASWLKAFEVLENKDLYTEQVRKGLKWTEHLSRKNGWQGHISDILDLVGGI
ncbi:MAG: glycosyltransferase family 4 protein [Deltaproteobacteria bacterium]|nr:glycosyltransferase family 4 protein [Deltaproteobacteria bacterium]